MSDTSPVTFTAPARHVFASVDVHASADGRNWRIVGANTAFDLDGGRMVPLKTVTVACHLTTTDQHLKCCWVHEDSRQGLTWTQHDVDGSPTGERRRRG